MSNNIHFSCICGIDIAKKVMQVFKVTSDGVVTNTSVSRKDFLEHFRNIPPALIGMEACATSQHWGRELQGLGHTVKLLSPKAVKPYVKGLKNDRNDAEGIYRALIMESEKSRLNRLQFGTYLCFKPCALNAKEIKSQRLTTSGGS